MQALLTLIVALSPLVPILTEQIENLINSIKKNGKITSEDEQKINAISVAVHSEVQRLVAERAAQDT